MLYDLKPKAFRAVSVSQIKNYDVDRGGCNRKWFIESLLGQRGPSKDSQILGTAVHHHLEEHFAAALQWDLPELDAEVTQAHLDKALPIAHSVIHSGHLRRPDQILGLEAPLSEVKEDGFTFVGTPWAPFHGVPWRGFVDVVYRADDGRIGVDDYKTTSRPKYAKFPHELAADVQMVGYSVWAVERLGADLDRGIPVRHLYAMTKPRAKRDGGGYDVWPVDAVVSREVVDREWPRVGRLIQAMGETALLTLDKVPRNPVACDAYGGCPHREACWSSPQKTQTTQEKPMASMMEAILARKRAAEAAAAGQTQTAQPQNTIPVHMAQDVIKDMARQTDAAVAKAQPNATGATGVKPPDAPAPIVHASEETLGTTKSPSTVAAEEQVTDKGAADGGRFRRTKAEIEAGLDVEEAKAFRASAFTDPGAFKNRSKLAPATTNLVAPNPEELTEAEEEAGLSLAEAKAFRASGETDPKVWLEKALSFGAPGHEPEAEAPKTVQESEKAKGFRRMLEEGPKMFTGGLVILVDALPVMGFDARPLEPYVEEMARKAAAFGQVPDYRLVDYGKGQGYLAGLIRDNPPAPGVYTVSSYGPTAKLALETLIPMASLVVRGV